MLALHHYPGPFTSPGSPAVAGGSALDDGELGVLKPRRASDSRPGRVNPVTRND